MKLLKRTALAIVVLILVSYSVIWLFTPLAVRIFAEKPLAEYGLELDSKSSIRLNLFASQLTVRNFKLLNDDDVVYSLDSLTVEYSLWRLLAKEVRIHSVQLDGMSILAASDSAGVRVAGVSVPQEPTAIPEESTEQEKNQPSEPLPFRISVPEVLLENLVLVLMNDEHKHEVIINKLVVDDTDFDNGTLKTNLDLTASIDGIKLSLTSNIELDTEQVHSEHTISLDNINLDSVAYLMPEGVEVPTFDSDLTLSVAVDLENEMLMVNDTNIQLQIAGFSAQNKTVTASLANLAFTLEDFNAQYDLTTGVAQLQGTTNLKLDGLSSALRETNDTLFSMGSFSTGQVEFEARDESFSAAMSQMVLSDIVASHIDTSNNYPALFSMASITINNIRAAEQVISIDDIQLGASSITVLMNEDGLMTTLVNTDALLTSATSDAETLAEMPSTEDSIDSSIADTTAQPNPQDNEKIQPTIKLGQLYLAEPMTIFIEDLGNSQPFSKTFELHQLNINAVDSSQLELQTTFDVALKDEEYFTLDLSGWIQPFKPKLNVELETIAREFPMNEVAPYLKDALGFEVKSGQLDADIEVIVVDDQLDSEVLMLMRGANFSASETPEDGSSLIGQTAIPLNVALNMLKDGDGNIELKIPVNGDVNDPSFGVQHVLGLVVKKVVFAEAKSYLLSTLVPYAKVISVALVAGEQALKVRFEDLPYNVNQTELDTDQVEFATQLGQLMLDKPEMSVNVCAVSIPTETTVEPALEASEVSSIRGQIFKDYMVDTYGLESSRLLLCSAQVDGDEDAKPRIEFDSI